jgi:hypothetical protein
MKTSYFNPEVHSFPFRNFVHCGILQCGGMCCTVLSKFYKGKLIDCDGKRTSFVNEIYNKQVGIIGSDINKSCRWGKSMDAINKISENIDIGKPTLLYLDLEDWDLVHDHFVIAFAIDDIPDSVKRVYIYDPNYVYKRHYCNDPKKEVFCIDPAYHKKNPPDDYDTTVRNFESYLEVNYIKETVNLYYRKYLDAISIPFTSPAPVPDPAPLLLTAKVLGFKWYGQDRTGIPVSYYTDESNIQHSCDIKLISNNPPEILDTKPLISHTIKISKDGNIPADLKLWWEGGQDLYESEANLFPDILKSEFGPSGNHKGLQSGGGHIDKTYKVYQNYSPSNPATILLQSNFIEKRLQLTFDKPALKTFTTFLKGTTPHRKPYYFDDVNNQIIKIQGLNQDNVVQVDKVPEGYAEALPINHVSFSFKGDDWHSAVDSGAFSLVEKIFYLGYINSNVVIELTHNGLYSGATVKMSSNDPLPIENPFIDNTVTFTLPKGTPELYNSNALKPLYFKIKGGGISAEFSESFSAVLQYRCLIIHEPLFSLPEIVEIDVFARYFEKLLRNIPHTQLLPQLENRFNFELAKHSGMDRERFKEFFYEQLISRFVNKSKTFWYRKRIHKNFIQSFRANEEYRKERVNFIINKSKNFQELKQNFEILEDQMRPLIGKALIAKRPFKRVITNVLKREWK